MMFWAPFITGVVIGGATVGLMAVGGVLRQRGTWATTMVAIASFYVVFAIQTGDMTEIIIHAGLVAGFVTLAVIGAWKWSWILAVALLGHGIFDISVGLVVSNPAPNWWGPFCLGMDAVLALALAAMLWRGPALD